MASSHEKISVTHPGQGPITQNIGGGLCVGHALSIGQNPQTATLIFHAQPFMHDWAGRGVLQPDFLIGMDMVLDSKCRQCRFVKPAQY
jgi:hypothetical protein